MCVIRESMELSQYRASLEVQSVPNDNGEQSIQINEDKSYEQLREEVLSILRKKMDNSNYKSQIKQCKKTAVKAHEEQIVGDSYRPLRRSLRKLKKQNKIE